MKKILLFTLLFISSFIFLILFPFYVLIINILKIPFLPIVCFKLTEFLLDGDK